MPPRSKNNVVLSIPVITETYTLHGIGRQLHVLRAMVIDVYALIYRRPERVSYSEVFAGYIIARAVVWRGADHIQPRSIVDPITKGDGLKRDQSLIVIHGQHRIKLHIRPRPKEPISRIRAHTEDPLVTRLDHSRSDDLLLFFAQQAIVP